MADIADVYMADKKRYERMTYNRVGKSGLKFPAVSLGLWHNFGSKDNYDNMKAMCRTAFDCGITQFDLANNYGRTDALADGALLGVKRCGCLLRVDRRIEAGADHGECRGGGLRGIYGGGACTDRGDLRKEKSSCGHAMISILADE